MKINRGNRVIALLRAAHIGPLLIVVTTTFILARFHLSTFDSFRIALAIFAGQLIVGWSNDIIDLPLDQSAGRLKKPLVVDEISVGLLKKFLALDFFVTFALSFFSPLGTKGTLIHFLGILSAVAYNAKLKSTIFSPLPYLLSFGALPWAIYIAAGKNPPAWLVLDFIFVAAAFHFLNVLKDLKWDIEQGVLGLPQRIGYRASVVTAGLFLVFSVITFMSARN